MCSLMYVIAREKKRKKYGNSAIADGITDAKNEIVDDPKGLRVGQTFVSLTFSLSLSLSLSL
jgi:hypothetical protein